MNDRKLINNQNRIGDLNLEPAKNHQTGLLAALVGSGRPLLTFAGLCLVLAGGFALFLAATKHFLPHDVDFLGMTESELCAFYDCRIVHFMFHDRTAFGGAIIAIGALYVWLAEFPLRRGEAWAWWLFAISGLLGFLSFLAYLGYGYLDTWHAAATVLLLPLFVAGLAKSRFDLDGDKSFGSLFRPATAAATVAPWKSLPGVGRACLLMTAAGMIAGGLTVTMVGMTGVFVPQDLAFMNLTAADLNRINPRLIPLIAHDRAGFGGALATCGVQVLCCVWCAAPSRSLWQALLLAGIAGFGTAIGVHPVIGYNDLVHLSPAFLGAIIFAVGMILSYRTMHAAPTSETASPPLV